MTVVGEEELEEYGGGRITEEVGGGRSPVLRVSVGSDEEGSGACSRACCSVEHVGASPAPLFALEGLESPNTESKQYSSEEGGMQGEAIIGGLVAWRFG
jgi:hypothetical protein